MNWREYRVPLGLLASLAAGLFFIYPYLDRYSVTEAEAAELHYPMVTDEIESLELERIRTKYRTDLSELEKEEYLQQLDHKLERLKETERCLRQKKVDCEPG